MTRVLNKFQTKHEDVIHHLAYDFYGKRLATCSRYKLIYEIFSIYLIDSLVIKKLKYGIWMKKINGFALPNGKLMLLRCGGCNGAILSLAKLLLLVL